MAVRRIRLDQNLPAYSFTTVLDNVSYLIEAAYNTRRDRWTLGIYDSGGTPLLVGIPLCIDRDLIAPYRTLSIPQGTLVCFDDTDAGTQPTLGSFLLDHTLYYVEAGG